MNTATLLTGLILTSSLFVSCEKPTFKKTEEACKQEIVDAASTKKEISKECAEFVKIEKEVVATPEVIETEKVEVKSE